MFIIDWLLNKVQVMCRESAGLTPDDNLLFYVALYSYIRFHTFFYDYQTNPYFIFSVIL